MILSDISKREIIVQGEDEYKRITSLNLPEGFTRRSESIGKDIYKITILQTNVGTLRDVYYKRK